MNFLVEQVIEIKGKVYVMTKCLGDNINFALSDSALLNDIEIENWCDIPRKIDENGNQRLDIFTFALKHNSDKEKITEGEILDLKNL